MSELQFEKMRQAMVDSQLRTTAVNDPRVVAAMASVPRERFVPAERAALAYVDRPVEIAPGRALNPPEATGKLLTEAQLRLTDRALLVGAGTGYVALLLARLVRSVVALEQSRELAAEARRLLAGVATVELVEGPLAEGWPAGAPYDLIFVDGLVERIPDGLIDQLADGGRLATGVEENGVRRLAVGRRAGAGFGLRAFADAETVPLPGFEARRAFTF